MKDIRKYGMMKKAGERVVKRHQKVKVKYVIEKRKRIEGNKNIGINGGC